MLYFVLNYVLTFIDYNCKGKKYVKTKKFLYVSFYFISYMQWRQFIAGSNIKARS